ncbi:MAG TPA: immunoglobulin-like domain-containing protein [Bryobacteraceae bacterium]|nr:immunoglobulin-like domain-containing protein [Bryobacteraceae bacterium]
MKRISVVLAGCALVVLWGCPGSSSSSESAPTPTPTPLPEYDACNSAAPVDSGDPNKPVITLNGPRVVSQTLGVAYADAGATAADPHDGDVTSRIAVTGLATLDVNTVGDYMIRYNVLNSTQSAALEVVRMVRVHAGAFKAQTARDIGSTSAHPGYYEHLPVNYSGDPNQKFPLIIYQHGWFNARFLDPYTVQAPLSILEGGNLVKLINQGPWDDSRPFIVLSPQRCVDALTYVVTAAQTKLFLDYAINTYNVDTSRIYMGGHSQGSGDTWDYVTNYPHQLAAVIPISGPYGTSSGCVLKETPAWAFNGEADTTVPYQGQVDTVNSINACNPVERAKITVLPGVDHVGIEMPVLGLTGLGQGLPAYDIYDQNIYDWLLAHSRAPASSAAEPAGYKAAARAGALPSESLAFTVAPSAIVFGHAARLRWSVEGATECVASGDWIGKRPTHGSETVTPVAPGSYGYVLSCTGTGGYVARAVTLVVGSPLFK